MNAFAENLMDTCAGTFKDVAVFAPVARYNPKMDALTYLNEDCSFRADRVDPILTVLWHPYEDKLVGIKLKGVKFLFNQLTHIIDNLQERDFLPLIKMFEAAMIGGLAKDIMDDVERDRRKKMYEEARAFVNKERPEFRWDEIQKQVA